MFASGRAGLFSSTVWIKDKNPIERERREIVCTITDKNEMNGNNCFKVIMLIKPGKEGKMSKAHTRSTTLQVNDEVGKLKTI